MLLLTRSVAGKRCEDVHARLNKCGQNECCCSIARKVAATYAEDIPVYVWQGEAGGPGWQLGGRSRRAKAAAAACHSANAGGDALMFEPEMDPVGASPVI